MAPNRDSTYAPEERELVAKQAELTALNERLAQHELDFATLRAELHAFEQQYVRIVGTRFAEIDELEAQIAEALSRRQPTNDSMRQQAQGARERAVNSAGIASATQLPVLIDFRPSEGLKSLYREIARRIHPDLAIDDDDRDRRNRMMAAANRAYEEGNEAQLRAILVEWETSPESVKGEGVGAELVRAIRKIHQVNVRLGVIESEIEALKGSELSLLRTKVNSAKVAGHDLLSEMAAELDARLIPLRQRRDELRTDEVSL
jgi:hypothetical protein